MNNIKKCANMTGLQVTYQNKLIHDGEILTKEETLIKPNLIYEKKNNKYYTVIMVDPDAPNKNNPIYKYWLHWLTINNTEEIIEYQGPNPPHPIESGSGKHRYYILIFEQKDKIIINEPIKQRSQFNLFNFMKKHNLELVTCRKFIVAG